MKVAGNSARRRSSVSMVLLVEDDPDVSEAISIALQVFGIGVQRAANGLVALQLLQQGLRPNVILLDLMMPVMDGREFRSRQQADPALAGIPVVVLSAQPVASTVRQQMAAALWLRKPVDIDVLLQAIERASQQQL